MCKRICPVLSRPVKSDSTSKFSSPNKSGTIDIEHTHHVTVNLSCRPAASSGQSLSLDEHTLEVTVSPMCTWIQIALPFIVSLFSHPEAN